MWRLASSLSRARAVSPNAVSRVVGWQSNHSRAVVAAARRIGVQPVVVLRERASGDDPNEVALKGNLFLMVCVTMERCSFVKMGVWLRRVSEGVKESSCLN